jgi:hypothetical protein
MRVVANIANMLDGTSLYRGHGALSHLHKIDPSIHVEFPKDPDVLRLIGADALIVQRPDRAQEVLLCKTAKRLNIPVIVDYDDYLLGVPDHNRYVKVMEIAGNDYKGNVIHCLQTADQVWVATDQLKSQYSEHTKSHIQVIKNSFDHYLYDEAKAQSFTKTVLWRGSYSPQKDLGMFRPEIIALIEQNQDFRFAFMCDRFFPLMFETEKKFRNMSLIKAVPVHEYYYHLERINASVYIVPLEDIMFNRCKSDIAALEAQANGALSIVPDWPEWDHHGSFRYKDRDSFKYHTEKALKLIRSGTQVERKPLRPLREANQQRVNCLKGLIDGIGRK